jgi:hypothetical protein
MALYKLQLKVMCNKSHTVGLANAVASMQMYLHIAYWYTSQEQWPFDMVVKL